MATQQLVSVIVPLYNEEAVLAEFHRRISLVFSELPEYGWELLFINDGSNDRSQTLIEELSETDPRIGVISLSRRFGKEIAMTAGFDYARGDAVIVVDADLQDPPELIRDFVSEWRNGFDMVYARRTHREGESWMKRTTATAFYRLMDKLSGNVKIPRDTGDFRLVSRRAVDAMLQLREQHRFMKGIFSWVGFPSKAIDYRRDARPAGNTKFSYFNLWNFALEGITSFSLAPLKLATYVGLATAFLAMLYSLWIIAKTLLWGESVQGFPTLIVTILFLGGVQLFFIGVLGEYLGRIFDETKQRPLYFVQGYQPARSVPSSRLPIPHRSAKPVD